MSFYKYLLSKVRELRFYSFGGSRMASNKKFKNVNYPTRQVTDMRDLVMSSVRLYGEKPAYLVKNTPGGKFQP